MDGIPPSNFSPHSLYSFGYTHASGGLKELPRLDYGGLDMPIIQPSGLESSPGVIMLLQDKIEAQARVSDTIQWYQFS